MFRIPSTYNWYALYCRSRHEKRITEDLTEDGFEVYCPLVKTRKKWSDRFKWVEEPMFRSYLFVRVSHREYFKVLQHPSVMKYIHFGGKPSVVPQKQIDAIKRVLGEKLNFQVTNRRFKPGEEVAIEVGPMSGLTGQVVRQSGRKKLYVRVGDTGYGLLVQVPVAYLAVPQVV